MKLSRFFHIVTLVCLTTALFVGCSDDEGIDNRDTEYGYVQFKLYKEASYQAPSASASAAPESRAIQSQIDHLADASKVTVRLEYGGTTIAQTLTLSAADKESAEFGLRSEKLKLLTGEYRIITFSLYDANDELLYNGSPLVPSLSVVPGGLTSHDLTVNVLPRGAVRFSLVKDLSAFENTPKTRAVTRQYTFDEIAWVNITVQNKSTNQRTEFTDLPMKFSIHFDEDNEENPGFRTSSASCDSLLSLPGGDYRIVTYAVSDSNKKLLETNTAPAGSDFSVEDNLTTDVKAKITLYESDDYIKDYYALYRIWKALDGENWSYAGESYSKGSNWNFDKDCDLWGDQPGVHLHTNGRVAKLDLGEFGIRGHMPEELGSLDQLVELYLGTHNDKNILEYDPTADPAMSMTERSRNRMENHKKYLSMIYPAPQMSEPCARALREHDIHIAATALYDAGQTEKEIIDPATGMQRHLQPRDISYGKLCNGLKSLPASIGKLTKLENFNLANSEIESLPDEMALLESCTDMEIYNCPNMSMFPQVITRMPKLISLNISNNIQWSQKDPEGLAQGLAALGTGPAKDELQILYCTDNGVTEIPASFRNFKKLGLLDMTNNKISKLPDGGMPEIAFTQLRLDHNLIEEFPSTDGKFCAMEDMETFSAAYNRLTEFPNIFNSKGKYVISTVNLAYNRIEKFPDDFRGVLANTLTLSFNPLKVFPKTLLSESNSYVVYLLMSNCNLTEFPKDSFNGKYAPALQSIDLTYNQLSELPNDLTAEKLPYLYGVDLSYNSFSSFPYGPLNAASLTVYAIRGQRDAEGNRCLREWPTGLYRHTGLRGFFIGSNDLRTIDDKISYLIYHLDISDNPNITFDASSICLYWRAGAYKLIYDKTQNILNCDAMLE